MTDPETAMPVYDRREHYEVEKALAAQVRIASRDERRRLYGTLYNQLFQRLPQHPQLARKASAEGTREALALQLPFLKRFVNRNTVFVEVGAGDCAVSFAVAPLVSEVYAIDVSSEVTDGVAIPPNFRLVLSDGCEIPVAPNSADLVYSNQLMEHLHPDDALDQLVDILRVLKPGGSYICVTPNRLNGPHDVSRGFDPVATGFHLREYTNTELARLLRTVGFRRVRKYLRFRGSFVAIPLPVVGLVEAALEYLPRELRSTITQLTPLPQLLNVRLVATK
jgi:SAM-dependent methyltransferase